MTTEDKLALITRNLDEVLTIEDLTKLLESNTPLKHYIGFEISGKLHIGSFFQLMKVRDLQQAGAEVTLFLADYHSAVNDKLGGDLEVIKRMAEDYFKPAMKKLFEILGGDVEKLQFKLCSDEYEKHPEYWMTFIEMGKATTLARSKRSITILGREEAEDSIETAKIMYPIMQAADIFMLQTNIAQAGMDQRKVHVVARDGAMQVKTSPLKNAKGEQIKPVAIHTPILLGLDFVPTGPSVLESTQTGELSVEHDDIDVIAMKTKMSKSKADSGVLIHDEPEEIRRKLNNAYAPEGVVENNPVLNWTKYLVFNEPTTLVIERPEKWGGNLEYSTYDDLEKAYAAKELHPQDLKLGVASWLIEKLAPVRAYFADGERKAALEEIERLTAKK